MNDDIATFQAAVAAMDAIPSDFDTTLFELMLMCPRCEVIPADDED